MKESTLWLLHIVTALVLVIAIPIHMHNFSTLLGPLGAPGYAKGLSWEFVQERARSIFYTGTYLTLLGAATYHGLYGVRSMLFELSLSRRLEQLVSVLTFLLGVGLFGFGAYAAIFALFI